MPTLLSLLLSWSFSSSALIRMSRIYLPIDFMFEEPLSSLYAVYEILEIISL